ncbi:hypothetical protein ACFTWF_14115 [Rhodococcus sp. NPDC056960]|uniref:hypothetical protein n=1 Tax=Rhodococcus sp. NPDC056960 TaxID=3345982 RepID=UPI00362C1B8B
MVVEYALRGLDSPLAVSTYTTHRALLDDVRPAPPTAADLAAAILDTTSTPRDSERPRTETVPHQTYRGTMPPTGRTDRAG